MNDEIKVISDNRKARHDYDIKETFEAGVVLVGSEIKSLRLGQVNLRDSYALVRGGEIWLMEAYIAPYSHGGYANHDPRRSRKLLLHRDEIIRLAAQVAQKGLTLVPMRIYLKRGRAKVELGLAKGRKTYDKRQAIADRDAERNMERALKEEW